MSLYHLYYHEGDDTGERTSPPATHHLNTGTSRESLKNSLPARISDPVITVEADKSYAVRVRHKIPNLLPNG
jgi:hypothetical protein